RDAEGVDEPRRLAAGVADRLAGLDAERLGELVEALLEPSHAVGEDGLPGVGWELTHRAGRPRGGADRLVDVARGRQGDPRGDVAGVFVGHREVAVRRARLAAEVERPVSLHRSLLRLGASTFPLGGPGRVV